MATNVKGRGIRVEVATAFAAAVAINGVSQANPAVATETAHGFANNDVGYFDNMSGMEQLEDQAVRVKNQAANTFELQGLNTTNYTAFTSGDFHKATTFATLAEATSYSIPDASGEDLDATTLLDVIDVLEQGNLAAQPININVLARETPSTALQYLIDSAMTGTKCLVRITLQGGAVRLYYGVPSSPGEDVQAKQLGKGSVSVKGRGLLLRLAA